MIAVDLLDRHESEADNDLPPIGRYGWLCADPAMPGRMACGWAERDGRIVVMGDDCDTPTTVAEIADVFAEIADYVRWVDQRTGS